MSVEERSALTSVPAGRPPRATSRTRAPRWEMPAAEAEVIAEAPLELGTRDDTASDTASDTPDDMPDDMPELEAHLRVPRALARYFAIALAAAGVLLMGSLLFGNGPERSVVTIVTVPAGAAVSIDGVASDFPAPLKVVLRPGSHDVDVRRAGYRSRRERIRVDAGAAPREARIVLEPTPES